MRLNAGIGPSAGSFAVHSRRTYPQFRPLWPPTIPEHGYHPTSENHLVNMGENLMIRLIASAAFALAVTTSAQAMPVAPVHGPDGIITQAAYGCGPGRTRIRGVCV